MTAGAPEKHNGYYRLIEALVGGRCGFCALLEASDLKYMDDLFYENVNDPSLRSKLRESLGFRGRGLELAETLADALGMSLLYSGICRRLEERLDAGDWSLEVDACPVESHHSLTEGDLLRLFLAFAADEGLWEACAGGGGLCLHHLRLCLAGLGLEGRRRLAALERVRLEGLRQAMQQLVDKSRADSSEKPSPGETAAWRLAARKFGGVHSQGEAKRGNSTTR